MSRKFVLRAALAAAGLAPATAVCLAPATAAAATSSPTFSDHAIIARDIVPSGQPGAVPPPAGADRQAEMYDDLTPLFNKVSSGALNADFKAESLGATGPGPYLDEPVPHPGVTIKRDAFDVPHIFGKSRDDVTWGSGWVLAEDRGLLLQQARYDSLVAAIDVPGVKALDLVSNLETFKPSTQTEREVAKQTGALLARGAKGRAVLHDIDVYLTGINAYFRAHGGTTPPFTRTDIYAFDALKGQFVGEGGERRARSLGVPDLAAA